MIGSSTSKQTSHHQPSKFYSKATYSHEQEASHESSVFSDAECEDVDEMVVISGNNQF